MKVSFFSEADVEAYRVSGDPLLPLLGDPRVAGEECERWLLGSDVRRMIAWRVYGELLNSPSMRILDVGAGFSSLSYLLAARHEYRVVDLKRLPTGVEGWVGDWWDVPVGDWDVVISTDLFPNADQRLAEFLDRFDRQQLRLTLTTYRNRWYRTRRIDARVEDGSEMEVLTVKAWDWERTADLIGSKEQAAGDLFANGRQVCLVDLP